MQAAGDETATDLLEGELTMLFTDVEGSTRLLQDHDDLYPRLLVQHHALMRTAIAKHDGLEVATAGDSFFVVFRDAASALRAALAMQRALRTHAWEQEVPLRVRMGLHTGRPIVSSVGYAGLEVHRAARIAAVAHGGQVICSAEVLDAAGDRSQWQGTAVLRDLGEHRLKDLVTSEHLVQVTDPDGPADFPPLRTGPAAPSAAPLVDPGLPPADVPCPYPGLAAFGPHEEIFFAGRDKLVEAGLRRLQERRFLALIGPSGGGKSSLARAGLLPAWRRSAGPVAICTPGDDPRAAISAALEEAPGLLLVDQLEELFTQGADPVARRAAVALLGAHLDNGGAVVTSLRADFYGRLVDEPTLARLVQDSQLLVGPMEDAELKDAIEVPAAAAGLLLEPGLVQTVMRDVAGRPGALPLLSHAMRETWRRRSDRWLTLPGYEAAGGVAGALARTADTVHARLESADRALLRRLLERLTNLGDEGEDDTRRRVRRSELVFEDASTERVSAVLEALAGARLVTLGEDTVEVSHEALFEAWPRLRRWLADDRSAMRAHRRLTEAALVWQELQESDDGLLRGVALSTALEVQERRSGQLNALETRFLQASADRQEAELGAEARRTRRLRRLNRALSSVAAVTVVASTLAYLQAQRAQQQADRAAARGVATAALASAADDERLDSALLAAGAALRTAPTRDVRSALLALLQPAAPLTRVHGVGRFVTAAARAGSSTVFGDVDGRLHVLGRAAAIPLTAGPIASVAVSDDGSLAAAGTTTGNLVLVELTPGRTLWRSVAHNGPVGQVRIGPAGAWVRTAGSEDGVVAQWVTSTGAAAASYRVANRRDTPLAFDRTGGLVLLASVDGTLEVSDVAARRTRARWPLPPGRITSLALGGSSRTPVIGFDDGTVAVPGKPAQPWFEEAVEWLDVAPDGGIVAASRGAVRRGSLADAVPTAPGWRAQATTGRMPLFLDSRGRLLQPANETVLEWNAPADSSPVTRLQKPGVTTASVSRNGDRIALLTPGRVAVHVTHGRMEELASFAADGPVAFLPGGDLAVVRGTGLEVRSTTRSWPVRLTVNGLPGTGFRSAFASPDGRWVVLLRLRGLVVVDLREKTVQDLPAAHRSRVTSLSFTRDSRRFVTSGDTGDVRSWVLGSPTSAGPVLQSTEEFRTNVVRVLDDERVLVGANAGLVRVLDLRTGGQRSAVTIPHQVLVMDVTDSGTYAVAGEDGTLRFGDLSTGRLLGTNIAVGAFPPLMQFLDDGDLLLVDDKGLLRLSSDLWSPDSDALVRRVCRLVGRELTSKERRDLAQGVGLTGC